LVPNGILNELREWEIIRVIVLEQCNVDPTLPLEVKREGIGKSEFFMMQWIWSVRACLLQEEKRREKLKCVKQCILS
jgi:hypothetical protein